MSEGRSSGGPDPALRRLPRSFSERFVVNTIFNFMGRFSALLATLVLTPYVIARLGTEVFGAWVLLSVFANAFGLLDAGLSWSFIKYVAEYEALGDRARINLVLVTGALFYVVLAMALVGLGWIGGAALLQFFRVGVEPGVLLLLLTAFGVNNFAALMLSLLRGLQRMDQSNLVEVLMTVARIGGTVLALELGTGIAGLAGSALLVAAIGTWLGWIRLRRVAPWIRLGWSPDWALLGQLLGYGGKLQLVRLSELICFQVDRLIISGYLGVGPVAFYEVGSRLVLFMRALPYVMISVLTPAVSELNAIDDRARLDRIYRLASKYVVVTSVALVFLAVIEAETLLALWLGPGFEGAVVVVRVLAVGYGLNAIGAVAGQTGSGLGRPEFEMGGALLLTVLNPLLSILLIRTYGVKGVAMGTSCALAVGAVYVVYVFHRGYPAETAPSWLRRVLWPPSIAALSGAAAVWLLWATFPSLAETGQDRVGELVRVGLTVPVFLTAYGIILVVFRYIDSEDLARFKRMMRVPMVIKSGRPYA